MTSRSLWARLLTGAILWTIGLLFSSIVAITAIMLQHDGLPRIVHITAYTHAGFVRLVQSGWLVISSLVNS